MRPAVQLQNEPMDPQSPPVKCCEFGWSQHDEFPKAGGCMILHLEEKGERLTWQRKQTAKWRSYFEPVDCAINRNQSSSGCDLPLLVDDWFDGDTIQYTLGLSSSIHHQNYRKVMNHYFSRISPSFFSSGARGVFQPGPLLHQLSAVAKKCRCDKWEDPKAVGLWSLKSKKTLRMMKGCTYVRTYIHKYIYI